tara:strand:+ start:1313 stop:1534 length:222 start_codon:yes stop_codon:yes gene_type:complete
MNKFILIIIVNFQLLDEPKNIEFRLKQNSYIECMEKANELKNSIKLLDNLISISAKCIVNNQNDHLNKKLKNI